MDLKQLKKEITFQWKIQTKPTETKKWCCVAYIDARDAMDLLDEVCGQDWWQSEFYEVRGTMFCRVGIDVGNSLGWVFKSDAWSKPDENSWEDAVVKWEPSDAFKRACVQWGIGRFLYSKDMIWITEAEYSANKYRISEFCNARMKKPSPNADDEYADLYEEPSRSEIKASDNRPWFNDSDLEEMKATLEAGEVYSKSAIKNDYRISKVNQDKIRKLINQYPSQFLA